MASPERILLGFYAVAVLLLFLAKCGVNNVADGGTETGNARVTGILYESDGKTPAARVNVSIRPRGTLADIPGPAKRLADTASVTTDDSGRFVFDSTLDTGTYVIEATDGNNAALVDSVHVIDTDSTVEVSDTLKPAGGITGTIHLSEGGDARKVFVLAFGINRFTVPDTDGAFTFDSLAEAAYDLRIISTLDDYDVLDTVGIPVVSEEVTDLDTLRLEFTGIPAVKGLTLSYDTLKQIVTLRWERADTGLVSGYNVYRRHVDSGLVKLNGAVVTDTVYIDGTAGQDESYSYQVKIVDKDGNEGLLSGEVGVEVVSIISFVGDYTAPRSDSFLGYLEEICRSGDGNYIGVTNWEVIVMDTTFKVLRRWGGEGQDTGKIYGALSLALSSGGDVYVADRGNSRIQVFDNLGNFKKLWGAEGYQQGEFTVPTYITTDRRDRVYVSDGLNSSKSALERIQIFDTTGTLLNVIGTSGNDDGQFNGISGIAVDSSCNVYIADYNNKRIQIFDSTGSFISKWDNITCNHLFIDGNTIITQQSSIKLYDKNGLLKISSGLPGSLIGVSGGLIVMQTTSENPLIQVYKYPSSWF
jgi:hypothetical protein